MIIDVIGNKFSVDCESHQINKIMFGHVRAFMEQNEYFHEEHFVEFLEEDDGFEVVDVLSPSAAIITIAQLEDWVEEAAVAEEEDDLDPLAQDAVIDDPEDDETYDEDDGDDDSE
jgi:hypothetical protein